MTALSSLLAEARRLDAAATKGPWIAEGGYDGARTVALMRSPDSVYHVATVEPQSPRPYDRTEENAAFIAFTRLALPALAAVAEAAVELRAAELEFSEALKTPEGVNMRIRGRRMAARAAFDAAAGREGRDK